MIVNDCPWRNKYYIVYIIITRILFTFAFENIVLSVWFIISMGVKIVRRRLTNEMTSHLVSIVSMSMLINFAWVFLRNAPIASFLLLSLLNIGYILWVCHNASNVIQKLEILQGAINHEIIRERIEAMQILKMIITSFFGWKIAFIAVELYFSYEDFYAQEVLIYPVLNSLNSRLNLQILVAREIYIGLFFFSLWFVLRKEQYQRGFAQINIDHMADYIRAQYREVRRSKSALSKLNHFIVPKVYRWIVDMKKLTPRVRRSPYSEIPTTEDRVELGYRRYLRSKFCA